MKPYRDLTMKKVIIITIFLCATVNITFAMQTESIETKRLLAQHTTTLTYFNLLRQKVAMGDADSILAMKNFYQSLIDPHYEISDASSQATLKQLNLINAGDNRVSDTTRAALKLFPVKKSSM